MTHQELLKLYMLKGRIKGHKELLEGFIARDRAISLKMKSDYYKGYYTAMADTQEGFLSLISQDLELVLEIIKEAENA